MARPATRRKADSRRYNATRSAFERDRERDAMLLVAGFRVVRFTERRLVGDAEATARTLADLLVSS